jgi:hypothetical protein
MSETDVKGQGEPEGVLMYTSIRKRVTVRAFPQYTEIHKMSTIKDDKTNFQLTRLLLSHTCPQVSEPVTRQSVYSCTLVISYQ